MSIVPLPRPKPLVFGDLEVPERVMLLTEYLADLNRRLCWVGDELAEYGLCAICVMQATSGNWPGEEHHCIDGDFE